MVVSLKEVQVENEKLGNQKKEKEKVKSCLFGGGERGAG